MMTLSKYLFWDVDASKINFETHADFVIPRVFQKGTLEDFFLVREFYTKETIIKTLTSTRYLDKKTLAFCCAIYQLQKENFKCFTQKQFTPKPLNF